MGIGDPRDPSGLAGLPPAGALAALRVDPLQGLAPAEVAARRAAHGFNEVTGPRPHPVRRLLRKFWGMSAWMLELIMVLSAVLGNYGDLALVAILLVVNAGVGFFQEQRASGVLAALRRRLQVNARVLRDARWGLVPARDLVPGDIVRLRPGDLVPADVKLLEGALAVDASALTGESADLDKGIGEVLASGSVVRRGEGNGVVLVTGAATLSGRTTALVAGAQAKFHIEAVVAKVVRWLFAIVAALLAVVVVLSLVRGVALREMLPLVLILLMSTVPVAFPVMFTVSMALGARELAQRGVLITRLSATEDAATMGVLCVDKTGTMTMNELKVTGVVPQGRATAPEVLFAGAVASQEANQDPIDLAFLAAARADPAAGPLDRVRILSFRPFDAEGRRTEAVAEQDGERFRVMKGALPGIARACGLEPAALAALEAQVEAATARGCRTLAVARGPEAGIPVLLGLVTLMDPPRPDAGALITQLRDLGVAVKMLTGDALPVALEAGAAFGLPRILPVAELKPAAAPGPGATDDPFRGIDGFAEVLPEDKYGVVRRLQAAGQVTGMTGDGVNDAPALRQAEVGIAVSGATDVAKAAASVILTDPGLINIIALVRQGRTIYQRILTWVINKISRTLLKAAFVAVAFVVTGRFVVSAFGMLLLVFMTDFATIALATDRGRPSDQPETWNLDGWVTVSVVLGLAMALEALLLLWFGWRRFGLAAHPPALYSFSFLTLLYFAGFSILSARERRQFWATAPSRSLVAAILADTLAGTLLIRAGLPGLAPLAWWLPLMILGYAMVVCLGFNDALKVALIHWQVPAAAPSAGKA